MRSKRMAGPLDGIKILDLTTVGFGPYATQIMGDYGADVIKLESPEGDITRGIAPLRNPGMGHFFLMANRNKRSIVLDLKQDAGREACLKLVEQSDVLVCSVRPAAMERLGLGYAHCKAINPRLVYVALVGFGQDGPYARRPAYDDIIQGMSGMADMQGGRSGVPRFVNASICDKIGSQFTVHATLAALFHRERSGEGQLVEVPMLETLVGFNLVEHSAGHTFEPHIGPAGYERTMAEYRRPYATTDGYVCVLPYNTRHWKSFFSLMERPEMLDDPRVNDPRTRSECIGELYQMVAECVAGWSTDALLRALEAADIPHGRSTPLNDLGDDPHLSAVGLFEHVEHPTEGRIRMTRPGVRFSSTPADIRTLPARLGEHSVDVLRQAGYDDARIQELVRSQITVDGRARE
ncbi:MAG: CoA transferase [Gammaproteobacteria bacterium]|nr:CoA transferase [Gammaproteobacteria bacterium]